VSVPPRQDKRPVPLEGVPSRLFVCFGFETAVSLLAEDLWDLVDDLFLGVALRETSGVGMGQMTGESKKAEGDGIVIVAIKV